MTHDHHATDFGPATTSVEFWESHYAALDTAWGTEPNPVLVDTLGALAPAPERALDLGAGHGGDALWLAARGWRVTAVDVSNTALQRVSAAAEQAGLDDLVTVERHDLTETFPEGRFDLVTACYFHTPLEVDRYAMLRRGAGRLDEGGLLVVVEHASVAPWSWKGDHGHATFPTPEESLAALALSPQQWRTERCAAPQRAASGPSGQTAVVTENVIVLRRRP
ncbi:MAG: class I SAM-dependent methyltransferase [Terracoccus sp.]